MQLAGGDSVSIPAALVKRQKHHFSSLQTLGPSPVRSQHQVTLSMPASAAGLMHVTAGNVTDVVCLCLTEAILWGHY